MTLINVSGASAIFRLRPLRYAYFLQTRQSQPVSFLPSIIWEKPALSRAAFSCPAVWSRIPWIMSVHFSSPGFSPSSSLQIRKLPPVFSTRYTWAKASPMSGQK